MATSLTNFFGAPFFGGEFFFSGGPTPPPAPAAVRYGAPIWLKPIWTQADEEEFEDLQEECAELEEVIAQPILYAPRKQYDAASAEKRLQKALERIRFVQDKLTDLRRRRQEAEDYADFLKFMGEIED